MAGTTLAGQHRGDKYNIIDFNELYDSYGPLGAMQY